MLNIPDPAVNQILQAFSPMQVPGFPIMFTNLNSMFRVINTFFLQKIKIGDIIGGAKVRRQVFQTLPVNTFNKPLYPSFLTGRLQGSPLILYRVSVLLIGN